HETTAQIRSIRELRTVPGTIAYNQARHLELTAPVDCVVSQVQAEPGMNVQEGALLVVLSSSAVGLARDDVLGHEAELALAKKEHAWVEEIAANTQELVMVLKQRPKLSEVEQNLEGKKLGDYREKILAAYSKLIVAE